MYKINRCFVTIIQLLLLIDNTKQFRKRQASYVIKKIVNNTTFEMVKKTFGVIQKEIRKTGKNSIGSIIKNTAEIPPIQKSNIKNVAVGLEKEGKKYMGSKHNIGSKFTKNLPKEGINKNKAHKFTNSQDKKNSLLKELVKKREIKSLIKISGKFNRLKKLSLLGKWAYRYQALIPAIMSVGIRTIIAEFKNNVSQEKDNIPQEKDNEIPSITLKDFKVKEVLNVDNKNKVITLAGYLANQKEGKGVLKIRKSDFYIDNDSPKDYTDQLQNYIENEALTFNNDKYKNFGLTLNSGVINLQRAELIYPATDDYINKLRKSEYVILNERAEDYNTISKKFIENLKTEELQWVYNIIDGKEEVDNVSYRDNDPTNGFLIVTDYKMQFHKKDTFHLLAIVNRRDLRSLRDQTAKELPLLENIRDKSYKTATEIWGIKKENIRLHFHYHPTYYHLHIHITHSNNQEASVRVERSHLLQTVIQNIKLVPDYYQRANLEFSVKSGEPLYTYFIK